MSALRTYIVGITILVLLVVAFPSDTLFAQEKEKSSLSEEDQRIRSVLDAAFAVRPTNALNINKQQRIPEDGGFLLAPGNIFLVADPGEVLETELTLLSRAGTDVIYEIEVRDLEVDPETGTTRFYAQHVTGPHPAKDWMEPLAYEIALHHGERAQIPVSIRVPEKADAGDHMASIFLKKKRMTEKAGGVIVNAYTSILTVVTVRGEVVEEGVLESFFADRKINWSYPINLFAKVRNTGTVHITAEGPIIIRNIFGIPVDEIDMRPWHTLRGSAHTKRIEWAPKFAIGRYTATTEIRLSTKLSELPSQSITTVFWIIPLLPLLLVILVVFLVSFFVQYFINRFEIRRKPKEDS